MAYIEFNHISKEYVTGETIIKALDDASFIVEKGELVVVLGTSGAGKTTALNILGGMDTATSGQVVVDGNEVPESEIIAHSADITRYLSKDENGVPTVGNHSVSFFPRTLIGDDSTVRGTITIKTIEKR